MQHSHLPMGSRHDRRDAARPAPPAGEHAAAADPLAAAIHDSPAGVAQRRQIDRLFGAAGSRARQGAATSLQPASVLQAVPWKSDGSNDVQKSALSAELKEGVEAVVASPAAVPESVRAWVELRVKEQLGYATKVASIDTDAAQDVEVAWGKAKPAMMKGRTEDEGVVKGEFITARTPAVKQKLQKKYDEEVKSSMRGSPMKDLKWGAAFDNNDGDLPGDKGAGGYAEYYAAPDPGDAVAGGFYGRNRVLLGGATYYVTADHYVNYRRVLGL